MLRESGSLCWASNSPDSLRQFMISNGRKIALIFNSNKAKQISRATLVECREEKNQKCRGRTLINVLGRDLCESRGHTQRLGFTNGLYPRFHQPVQNPLLVDGEDLLEDTTSSQLRDCEKKEEEQSRAKIQKSLFLALHTNHSPLGPIPWHYHGQSHPWVESYYAINRPQNRLNLEMHSRARREPAF